MKFLYCMLSSNLSFHETRGKFSTFKHTVSSTTYQQQVNNFATNTIVCTQLIFNQHSCITANFLVNVHIYRSSSATISNSKHFLPLNPLIN